MLGYNNCDRIFSIERFSVRKAGIFMSGAFLLLAGGLLIIIFAVVVAVVSSVVSSVAANVDEDED